MMIAVALMMPRRRTKRKNKWNKKQQTNSTHTLCFTFHSCESLIAELPFISALLLSLPERSKLPSEKTDLSPCHLFNP